MEQAAVFEITYNARSNRDAQYVAAADRDIGAILVELAHFGIAAHQFDGEGGFRDAGAGTVVIQADIEHRPGFTHGKLQIAVAGNKLLLRYGSGILAAVATAGLQQVGTVNSDIDQLGPGDTFRAGRTGAARRGRR